MKIGSSITTSCVNHPKLVALLIATVTILLLLLALLPSIWPRTFRPLLPVSVDTDPENMLPEDEAVRVFHNRMKKEMSLYDMVVLGIVNEEHPDGVFNPDSLKKIYELTKFAQEELTWDDKDNPGEKVGVIGREIIAPSTVEYMFNVPVEDPEQGPQRALDFKWLMDENDLPATREEALEVRRRSQRMPFLDGTLISEDGKAICIYLPLTHKDLSHRVATALKKKIATFKGSEKYFISGLPVAEDTFGVEMFKQMAISAPIAMLVIFLLMFYFFRKITLIISPMIIAMAAVIITMSLLIITGNTIHIMSSMIPIFIMPIAVLDAVHILSEFFDRYQETGDRKKTIIAVMRTLFIPMLYTSLTTTAGFASLALTPIPPVQTFGLFIAIGVMSAWLLTITFVPAYIMLLKKESLENFGMSRGKSASHRKPLLTRLLGALGGFTYKNALWVIVATIALGFIAGWGISRIHINDNPTRWFKPSHEIRVADRVLNQHFGGTYMAYLSLTPKDLTVGEYIDELGRRARERSKEINLVLNNVFEQILSQTEKLAKTTDDKEDLILGIEDFALARKKNSRENERFAWDEVFDFIDEDLDDPNLDDLPIDEYAEAVKTRAAAYTKKKNGDVNSVFQHLSAESSRIARSVETKGRLLEKLNTYANDRSDLEPEMDFAWVKALNLLQEESEIFKSPRVHEYISALQEELLKTGFVGKSNSIADMVKTVHRELFSGEDKDYRTPDSLNSIGLCLEQFGYSERPDDIWHFVTQNFRKTSIWVQLKSGNNRDMKKVIDAVDDYIDDNPPPFDLRHKWFGLTYINVVWQEKMVSGMLQAFLGSFLIVLLMMILLFRSGLWGLLSMVPLTLTIGLIYGTIGFIGKDYDMPVAVLSALSLGLAIDYAIHFLARSREMYRRHESWKAASPYMFDEPSRAIVRNVIVIGVGFLPLLAASLVPYQTVGIFLASILLIAGIATLIIIPALIKLLEPRLFPKTAAAAFICRCGTCAITSLAIVALLVINLVQFTRLGHTSLTVFTIIALPVLLLICWLTSRSEKCRINDNSNKES